MDYINHFIFLRAIAENLAHEIEGERVSICYSFSDKEMILHLENGLALVFNSVYNKSVLYLQERAPAKKNVAPKFRFLNELEIREVLISPLDRNIILKLEEPYSLIFKMHGRNANVLVMKEGKCTDMLNDNFKADQLRTEVEYRAEGKLDFIWNEELEALFEDSNFKTQKSFLLEYPFKFEFIENEIRLSEHSKKSALELGALYARHYLSENALGTKQRLIENRLKNDLKKAQKSVKSLEKNLQKIEATDYQKQGFQEPMRYFIRGYISTLMVGKILPVFGPNKNSGIAICAGAGFMQHKIHYDYASQSLLQLQDDYLKGYDRLSNGLLLKQSIGYINYANNDLVNFKIEFLFSQGFTENRRSWDYLEKRKLEGVRNDFFYGLGITWFFPIYKRKANDFYLN